MRASLFLEQLHDVARQPLAVADEAHTDALTVEVVDLSTQEKAEQPHEIVDLVGGAVPVLGGKAEKGEIGNTHFCRAAHDIAHCLDTATMAGGAWQAARLGPASVAVHDDGDVTRRRRGLGFLRRGGFHALRPA